MKFLVIANTFFLWLLGLTLVFLPEIALANASPLAVALGKAFGFSSIALGLLSAPLIKNPTQNKSSIIVLLVFHIGLTVTQFQNAIHHIAPFHLAFLHLIFVFGFLLLITKDGQSSKTEPSRSTSRLKKASKPRRK